ncbi:MAG: BMC domain-containing protein [Candidatus Nealsonbacteria bacterium]|nr:BMC domain-containing protein [Candidatus Nealsonbacteria bacterium]
MPRPTLQLLLDAMPATSLALLEIGKLTPALVVADRCAKAAGVEILGIENTMGVEQCIKLAGGAAEVREAGEQGLRLARQMGARADLVVIAGPTDETLRTSSEPPAYVPLLGIYDSHVKRENAMKSTDALGLIETQGLVAALHATDEMLKAASVELVGKEKIGAAYVTIMVRGNVAAVQAAVEAGRQSVEQIGGTLILADVIAHPHPELAALLPV